MKKAKILIVFAMFAVFLFCVGGCKQNVDNKIPDDQINNDEQPNNSGYIDDNRPNHSDPDSGNSEIPS
ncbi:hypothetical protein DWQ65_03080 [Treponema phagedenis]|uniref:Uncharacterized protein n=1 Tax=Treponema phagedenis TaxID=162 RepID=A0A0B7H0G8_TREPH|nr:hypothetical protein [Treponema phagedenis]NVP24668.1 hypothetical protein [Treponema phagedenis]QEK03148.1 hypothetical protein FUT83_04510 [Treponema phagedenis]QEK08774.1 hypothetical protein FUT81_04495 [Treponema phagedenis]QLC58863.1 hypothetical protein HW453_08655 [Treponema phagedenis]QSH99076.1 hypothetical protein DWQ65_03080 [Treponema phagedenis]